MKRHLSDDFGFRYESKGDGWARVEMSAESQKCSFLASYIGRNPLEDMLLALDYLSVYDNDDYVMQWESEPGLLRVELEREVGFVHIIVDGECEEASRRGLSEFIGVSNISNDVLIHRIDVDVTFETIVRVVVEEAERNLRKHGIVGFSKDWSEFRESFPLAAYLSLKGVTSISDGDLLESSLEREVEILKTLL